MSYIDTIKNAVLDQKVKQMKILQEKSGRIDPIVLLVILTVGIILVAFGYFETYITCIIATAIPIYWSIKAIETDEETDETQWLTYWAVYAVFSFFDLFAYFILKMLPFYYLMKYAFLLWCYMPNTQGAAVLYKCYLSKIFKKYEKTLDKQVDELLNKGKDMADQAKQKFDENKGKILDAGLEATKKISDLSKEE